MEPNKIQEIFFFVQQDFFGQKFATKNKSISSTPHQYLRVSVFIILSLSLSFFLSHALSCNFLFLLFSNSLSLSVSFCHLLFSSHFHSEFLSHSLFLLLSFCTLILSLSLFLCIEPLLQHVLLTSKKVPIKAFVLFVCCDKCR